MIFSVMPTAFVLINTEIGSEEEILEELKKIPNVKEAYVVYGVYDVVAKVEAESMDKLKEVISWRIAPWIVEAPSDGDSTRFEAH